MKRILSLMLIGMLLFCSGCGVIPMEHTSDNIKIVTTIFPPYDFAREIAGDDAEIHNIKLLFAIPFYLPQMQHSFS